MGVFKALIEISKKPGNYDEKKSQLLKKLDSFLIDFKKKDLSLTKSEAKSKDFDELILLIDFLTDLWNEIIVKKLNEECPTYRAKVLEKMLNRFLVQARETLFLLSHKLGLSAISNVRLFMEAFAITKHIIETSENEAKRFMDYGYYQQTLEEKSELDPRFIEEYGEKNKDNKFYSIPYGWCSTEEKMTGEKLIKKIGSRDLLDFYRLTCNYIHASPYSLVQISNSDNPFFPIPCKVLVNIVRNTLFHFIILTINYCFSDDEKHPYHVLLSMLVPDLVKFKVE